jgi:phosphorylase kinase alpha/beta subunit
MEELYSKACNSRQWALVRLSAGLLNKRLEELSKAVTHLLVRQKQLTVGIPSENEEPITCPKTNEELKDIMNRAYVNDPNSFTLAQVHVTLYNGFYRVSVVISGNYCLTRFISTHRTATIS